VPSDSSFGLYGEKRTRSRPVLHIPPLTRQRFVARVREALTLAGIDCSPYSGHSFRSGAATTASKCGISDATIKMLGRWKSSAYQLYVKTPRDQLARVSLELVKNMQ